MDNYISKETAVTLLRARAKQCRGMMGDLGGAVSGAAMLIESIPNTEVKPVVHGHWIWRKNHWECSACRNNRFTNDIVLGLNSAYCSYCGAKMDEEG